MFITRTAAVLSLLSGPDADAAGRRFPDLVFFDLERGFTGLGLGVASDAGAEAAGTVGAEVCRVTIAASAFLDRAWESDLRCVGRRCVVPGAAGVVAADAVAFGGALDAEVATRALVLDFLDLNKCIVWVELVRIDRCIDRAPVRYCCYI